MTNERLEILKSYIKSGVSPLLIQNISSNIFDNSVVLQADVDVSELNGYYDNTEFCPPIWYRELLEKSKNDFAILIIENINEIPLEEQTKFVEILKYKKISTFDLPKNCLVIVTCSDLDKNKINEEVYSLLAQI